MTSNLCFKCVETLKTVGATPVTEAAECDGCGGAGFGLVSVPALNDLQRQRCKNGVRSFVQQALDAFNEDTPRGSGPDGGPAHE